MKKILSISLALLLPISLVAVAGCTNATVPAKQPAEQTQTPSTAGPSTASTAASTTPAKVDIKPLDPDYFIPDRFKGKTILITGSARGMGKAAAIRAAREGANVVIMDILEKEGNETLNFIKNEGHNAVFFEGDISKTADCDRMVQVAVDTYGGLDYAINNAGVMDALFPNVPVDYATQKDLLPAPVADCTDEEWDRVISVNATGTFKSMRSELRQMLKQGKGGAIVNVGSIAAITGLAGNSAYVASKHAVTGLTRNAAIDYAPYGIRINSVNMAATDTPMVERATEFVKQQMAATGGGGGMGSLKSQSLLMAADSNNRPATPAEQVAVMLFLLSDEASNLTGAAYPTDGGWTAY
jgi:NAD(P)-dependent dehydrogenase (short-subunit alcohol dehydrogenase family)